MQQQPQDTRPISAKDKHLDLREEEQRNIQQRADMGDEEALIAQQKEYEYNHYQATGGYYPY